MTFSKLITTNPPPLPSYRRVTSGPYPRESYVCYHEAVPQNLVEMAFRMALGQAL